MRDTVLTNARLILAGEVRRGTLVMRDGSIGAIDDGPSRVPGAIDCEGDHLAPGLVELHTDNLERHLAPRPGVDRPLRAAIAAPASAAGLADRGRLAPGARADVIRFTESAGAPILRETWVQGCRAA